MRLGFWIFIGLPLLTSGQIDSLIYAEGKITNAITKEEVVAKISYQSLPYGSKVGFLNTANFSFPLYDGEKYSITIEASGFAPAKFILDPAHANAERKVIKDVALTIPGNAGDSVVHHAG